MSTARGNNPDHPWVQPIIVAKTGHHQDTVLCAARASIAVYFARTTYAYPPSNYDEWLAGPFTKTVRRASMVQMASLQAWAEEHYTPHATADLRDSAAIAFPPMRYADMPREIAKFQVSGTDFTWREVPRDVWGLPRNADDVEPPAPVHVTVNADLTTGKAAAAAAHAVWDWALTHRRSDAADPEKSETLIRRWESEGFPVELGFAAEHAMYEMSGPPTTRPIFDSGLTEVAPRTLTAVSTPGFSFNGSDDD